MRPIRSVLCVATFTALATVPLAAQELALRGAVNISKFSVSGSLADANPYDDRLTTTGFGGFVRFRFGKLTLQPEAQIVTRGARVSATQLEDEQLRLEYLELPFLLVVPVRVGSLEPFAFGGPMLSLETRCRYMVKEEGLRSNFGCDSPNSEAFNRNKIDYGFIAGGGAAYPLAGGRIFADVRYAWGMRDIVDEDVDVQLRNRTLSLAIGYMMSTERPDRQGMKRR